MTGVITWCDFSHSGNEEEERKEWLKKWTSMTSKVTHPRSKFGHFDV